MRKVSDPRSALHPENSSQAAVAFYAMSAYTGGIRKPGYFHVLRFSEGQTERINRFVPHRHDFFEIIWLRTGRGRVLSDLRSFAVNPRTLFLTSPGQVHAWEFSEPPEGEIVSFTHDFFLMSSGDPGVIGRMPLLYTPEAEPILCLDETEAARIDRWFQELREAGSDPAPGRDDIVRACLTVILTIARQAYERREPLTGNPPTDGDMLVRRFRRALEERFPEILEVGDYADLLQVSRTHLNDELRRQIHRSASEIIHERVLLEAKRLLMHSSLTISEIAYRLGFQDPSYFGRFFRKAIGQTPGMYRDEVHRELLAS